MIAPPSQIVRFLDGRPPYQDRARFITIAALPADLRELLESTSPWVAISGVYADKIVKEKRMHRDQFMLIPLAIQYGEAGFDPKHPASLTFFLNERVVYGRDFKLIVKRSWPGHENWVATFHRVDYSDIRRIRRRWNLLREHAL